VTCTHCGTEISDKAIICFRCGQATAEPAAGGPPARPATARPLWVALVGLAALVLAGLFMARAAAGQVPPALSYTVALLAAITLIWRISRRGRS
jgi:lipopolysaccharide export LptBFGC system permease protein LptF